MKHNFISLIFRFGLLFIYFNFFSAGAQQYNWAKGWGSTAGDENTATVVKGGYIYNTGYFTGTCDFDPGPGTANRVCVGVWDVYITKSDTSGNLIWAFTFGSTEEDKGRAITVDDSGYVYATGFYRGTTDFDAGAGTVSRTTKGGTDIYVIRLTPSGNLSWVATHGSAGDDRGNAIVLDTFRNVYTTGFFQNTVDFDPGTATYNLISAGNQDVFVQKLNHQGAFQSAIRLGAGNQDYATDMCQDGKHLYLTGWFTNAQDFDPGPATYTLTPQAYDPFVLKLDFNLNFKWARNFGSSTGEGGENICTDHEGNVISTGKFQSTADFDPGPGQYRISSKGQEDIYIHKMDSTGRFLWARAIGTSGTESVFHMSTDPAGNIYVSGQYKGNMDFDPGAGVFNLNSGTLSHGYILKLDRYGNFIWVQSIGSTIGDAHVSAVVTDANKSIYASGFFSRTTDFDPGSSTKNLNSNSNSADAFLLKWGQDKCSDMAIVLDSVRDFNCDSTGKVYARALHGKTPYAYEWNTSPVSYDSVLTIDRKGIYGLTVKDSNLCVRNTSVVVGGPDTIQGYDMTATLVHSPLRTGFRAWVYLDAYNALCTPVSGELKLLLNSLVTYDSASPAPSRISGDTLVWRFTDMYYASERLRPAVYLRTKTSAQFGERACFDVFVTPVNGDRDTLNNHKKYCTKIVNAYDPNDKQVYPAGSCAEAYLLKDSEPEYRIRFQNTGNAEAINIIITDTLSTLLDPSSLEVKSKSHPQLVTEIVQGNIIRFSFPGIMLPDSGSDNAGSQGYVVFTVRTKSGIAEGSLLRNKASIYFDYNPAVITNNTSNRLVSVIPSETNNVSINACRNYFFNGVKLTQSGQYRADLTGSDGCDSTVILQLNLTKIDTSVTVNGGLLTANQAASTYQWLDCKNGMKPLAGLTGRAVFFEYDMTVAVAIYKDGCGDTSACYTVKGTVIEESGLLKNIRIWPNPSTAQFSVDLSEISADCSLRIMNTAGQTVYMKTVSDPGVYTIEHGLPPGFYMIEMSYLGARILRQLIIQ